MLKRLQSGTYEVDSSELDIKSDNGRELRSTCPVCRDTREHHDDPSLSINKSNGLGKCHHCNASFIVKDFHDKAMKAPLPNTVHEPHRDFMANVHPLDKECKRYLASRNLDPKVAEKSGIGCRYYGSIPYLAFPFYENGTVVNIQYKSADNGIKKFHFEQDGKLVPWNISCITEGNGKEALYITEGMTDALALKQSGYQMVVSVPNGANSKMDVFDKYKELIRHNFSHIIFAGDTDRAGIELRDNIKKYFNDIPVGVVQWHWRNHDVKDANDMLMAGGTEAVACCIRNVKYEDEKYSVTDLKCEGLWDLYRNGRIKGKGMGLKGPDSIITARPGFMYVVTGRPGTGKSTFIDYWTMALLHREGWPVLYFTPENTPENEHQSQLVEILAGKSFDNHQIDEYTLMECIEMISGNVMHIHDDVDSIESIIEQTREAVKLRGIKVVVIDPFMYLKINNLHGVTESTRITEMLKEIRTMAKELEIVVIIVAHPRKPNALVERPTLTDKLYEIAGSSGFYNTCDAGIFLERPSTDGNILKISCCKSRNTSICKLGETEIEYDPTCRRYFDVDKNSTDNSTLFESWTDFKDTYQRKDISNYESDAPF